MKKRLTIICLVLSTSLTARAQSSPDEAKAIALRSKGKAVALPAEKAQPRPVPQIEKAPVIDGLLDDQAWKSAIALKDFYQIQPGDNIAPSEQTQVFLAYDSNFLYIGFRAFDDPRKVRANIAKRDDIFDDDHVGIYLDTFNDQRKAYALFFNPFGIQQDGIFAEGREIDYSVDVLMESKGTLNEHGYSVEIAIPFKSLRYKAGKDRLWGIHLYRRIKRINNELSSWMPISRDKSGTLNQAGHITGLESLSSEHTLEVIPSLTLLQTGRRVAALPVGASPGDPLTDRGRMVNAPINYDPGLSMKFSITPNVTLDFAVNPDFAQVEADQLVVTANERFPIFFEEKRPFFLEGIDIFRTPLSVVHTRTIVDPDYAVKLTGKQGRNSFGILLASDNAPGNFSEEERADPSIFPDIAKFLDRNAYIGVLRYKRDVGEESSIGLIGTSYNFIENHNQAGGFDGRFRINSQTAFSFQALGTTSRTFFFDPDRGENVYRTGNGFGYAWGLDKSGRHLSYNLGGSGRTNDYRANVGFTLRTNSNTNTMLVRYRSEPKPDAKLISWSVQDNAYITYDWQGRIQAWEHDPSVSFNFSHQTSLAFTAFIGREKTYEEEFGPKRANAREGTFIGNDSERRTAYKGLEVAFDTNPSKKYSLSFLTWYGWGLFDFDFGGGPRFPRVSPAALLDPNAALDPGPGNQWFANFNFTYQPTEALRTTFDYTKSRLVRRDTKLAAFDSNLFTSRTTYQFTRFTFARVRIDYDTLESNVKAQLLLAWTPNPGTSFYVGYNDDLNYNGFSPFTGRREPGFQRNSRTFFIKMSYLIRRSLF